MLALVDFDQPNFKLLDRFDWWGLIFMAGFLGTLEYVLEEGPHSQWLQDTSVAVCAAICAVSAIAFFWRVLTVDEPIVDIRTFGDRNFGIGCLISFCVGIGLYGLTYMYPRYLAEVRGKRDFWKGVALNTNLCYSNPEVRRIIVEAVVAYAREHPAIDYIHFWLAAGTTNNVIPETAEIEGTIRACLLYTSPSPRDRTRSRMPSSA